MKVSRLFSLGILVVALMAALLALWPPSAPRIPASASDAKSFDEKFISLQMAHQQGSAQTAHISESELTSKLQQGIDESAGNSQGAVAIKAVSVHLDGDEFAGVFTLNASGKELFVTMTGMLGVVDGVLQIQPSSAKLGRLPIPIAAFRHLLQDKLGTPEAREHMRLPDFVQDVRIENGELLVQSQ